MAIEMELEFELGSEVGSDAVDDDTNVVDGVVANADNEQLGPLNESLATTELTTEPENDDKYFQHLDLLAQMAQCERERREAASKLSVLQEDIKDAKKKLEACVIDMQEIASDIADLMDGEYVPPKVASKPDQPKIESAASEPVSTEWRNTTTMQLLDGTKGIGKKKLESLCELAPTVGELEDLRAHAAMAFKPFKELLPGGFGDKVANEIEDRLLDHVAKFSTPPASEQVKQSQPKVDDDTRMKLEDFAAETIDEIREEAISLDWTVEDCLAKKEDESTEIARGYADFEANKSSIDFPAEYRTQESVTLWCDGWVAAERWEKLTIEEEKDIEKTAIADDLSDL